MLRELISWPISTARRVIDLPRAMERSVREANELMEVSGKQLEVMRRQADQALEQAERMNELLGRVVKLTEPIERAQRGGEYVGNRLKEAIFGVEQAAEDAEEAAEEALDAAEEAEDVARRAGEGVEDVRGSADDARARDSATRDTSEEPPVSPSER